GDRNVEDVQVLAADQVQQQVEWSLERLEDHFQRVGRDVQVLRDLQHRLAVHNRQRHLLLLRMARRLYGVVLGGLAHSRAAPSGPSGLSSSTARSLREGTGVWPGAHTDPEHRTGKTSFARAPQTGLAGMSAGD